MNTQNAPIDIYDNPYKEDFPLLLQAPHLHFLDSAATAQRPSCTIAAFQNFYTTMNANPLRGLYGLSVAATEAIEDARSCIARFIGAYHADNTPASDEIVFTKNATEALNLAAHTLAQAQLKPGDEVLVSIMEHHSNLIPWQEACREMGAHLTFLRLDEHFHISEEELMRKLTDRVKIVAITQVSNVLGVQNDVARITAAAHELGALVVVDAAQSVAHMKVSVQELGCDFLAFSAHKVFGPFGVGVLWGKRELLQNLPVFLTGGEMIDSVREQDASWAAAPARFEAGTQDACGIYATAQALTWFTAQDRARLFAREEALCSYLLARLAELDFIELIGSSDVRDHVGVVSFNVHNVHPHDVSSILDGAGVCIRAGHHCAEPLLTSLGIKSCCRASLSFYNDASDIDALIDGLKTVWGIFNG